MITLRNKETGAYIGEITEEQLQFLINELEEDYSQDRDYWLERSELEYFRENGGPADLIKILESAMGNNEGLEIIWEKKK